MQNQYGRLKLVTLAYKKESRQYWHCVCKCGNKCIKSLKALKQGNTKSCGCLRRQHSRNNIKQINKIKQDNTDKEDVLRQNLNAIYLRYKNRHQKKFLLENFLSKDDFQQITKLPCFYCGKQKSNRYHKCYNNKGKLYPHIEKNKERRWSYLIHPEAYFEYNSLDRIDSSKGYILENVVSCCSWCNIMKSDSSFVEFIEHIQQIYNYLQLKEGETKQKTQELLAQGGQLPAPLLHLVVE